MKVKKMIEEYTEKLYYLAHPYTKLGKNTEFRNVLECIDIANNLLDRGFHVYPPIIITHWLHNIKNREYDFWLNEDKIMMERCDGIILSGDWEHSEGCLKEKKYFDKRNKEILYYKKIMNQQKFTIL